MLEREEAPPAVKDQANETFLRAESATETVASDGDEEIESSVSHAGSVRGGQATGAERAAGRQCDGEVTDEPHSEFVSDAARGAQSAEVQCGELQGAAALQVKEQFGDAELPSARAQSAEEQFEELPGAAAPLVKDQFGTTPKLPSTREPEAEKQFGGTELAVAGPASVSGGGGAGRVLLRPPLAIAAGTPSLAAASTSKPQGVQASSTLRPAGARRASRARVRALGVRWRRGHGSGGATRVRMGSARVWRRERSADVISSHRRGVRTSA